MKKSVVMIIVLVIIIAGAAGFYFFKSKDDVDASVNTNTNTITSSKSDQWNPYAKENHYAVTLSDQMISAGGGRHIVKMSVTLNFTNSDAYYRFLGYSDNKTAEKETSEHEAEDVITPMERKINDIVGSLMMQANDTQLSDRKTLKAYLKDGINSHLSFESEIVDEVLIENFIMQ